MIAIKWDEKELLLCKSSWKAIEEPRRVHKDKERDHSFSTYAKSSEKLTFLIPSYAHVSLIPKIVDFLGQSFPSLPISTLNGQSLFPMGQQSKWERLKTTLTLGRWGQANSHIFPHSFWSATVLLVITLNSVYFSF